ncbi:MAG: hypothetical protein JOZ19_11485 [Rubrobacter sp.]|nr:hypothetical protein [Rubrobacter sp.]
MKTVGGYLLTVTALIACPCHTSLTLPLLLGLLTGTTLGAALTANTGIIVGLATIYFLGALSTGLYFLTQGVKKKRDC